MYYVRPTSYQVLRSPERIDVPQYKAPVGEVERFKNDSYMAHLQCDPYFEYVNFHDTSKSNADADILRSLADKMVEERLPTRIFAGASAILEAAILDTSTTTEEKYVEIDSAEEAYRRSIEAYDSLLDTQLDQITCNEDLPYRAALMLAYLPIFKELIAGEVSLDVRNRTARNVLTIAELCIIQREMADKEDDAKPRGDLTGLLYECGTHLALLINDKSNQVPVPAFARSDNGLSYIQETRDIDLWNIEAGTSQRVEVKGTLSKKDKHHYGAPIITRKHLGYTEKNNIYLTIDAFAAILNGRETIEQSMIVQDTSNTVLHIIDSYYSQKQKIKTNRRGRRVRKMQKRYTFNGKGFYR